MGFHHSGTVRNAVRELRWHLALRASLILFPLFSMVPLHMAAWAARAAGAAEAHREYRCMPEVKYECGVEGCEKGGREFQDVESFTYNSRSGEISACLWTNCYAGIATLFRDASSGTITAIARLKPSAHQGNEPITLSLTVDDSSREGRSVAAKKDESGEKDGGEKREESPFTAVWGYGSSRLTFDMGRCSLRHLR
jgi:hypothetical protein